jgi:hypothetical protein
MKEELIFQERQRFNQWWFVLLMLIVNGILIYACISQIVLGKSFGNNPASDTMLIVVTVLTILFTIGFFFIRLDTVINEVGVYERMFPFQFRFGFTPWEHISDVSVKKISPIREFGGWGMRFKLINFGGNGISYGIGQKAYTVSGNNILELKLQNGKKILIGTQQPEALTEFLDKLDAKRNQK